MIDNIDNVYFPNPVTVRKEPVKPQQPHKTGSATPFSKILEEKLPTQGIKFSQHAQERLKSRGITLSDADMKKLEGAVDSVALKGGKESLVMLGDAAFVVSVKNRTVVTAMDKAQLQGNVFTNIDSAVLF